MKKRIKMLVAAMLALTIFTMLTFSGCSVEIVMINEDKQNYKVSAERTPEKYSAFTIGDMDKDVMPIGGFVAPQDMPIYNGNYIQSQFRDEVFKSISDVGVNYLISTRADFSVSTGKPKAIEMLEMAEKYGLYVIIEATSVVNLENYSDQHVGETAEFIKVINELKGYKSFGGIMGRDEPGMLSFDNIKLANQRMREAIDATGVDTMLYWNLLSMDANSFYWYGDNSEIITYDEYLQGFIETNPQFLKFDLYPFQKEYGELPIEYWFKNLSKMNTLAKENGLAWWGFVQTGGNFDNVNSRFKIMSESEFYWDISTMLAYGAKGLAYFTLCFPPEWVGLIDFDSNSLIDPYGSKNSYYFYAQKMNTQVRAIDSVLMQSAHMGMLVSGNSPADVPNEDILGKSWREIKSVSGDALVGCFDYKGKTALLVVNNTTLGEKQTITLRFDDKYGYDITQRGEIVSVTGKQIPLTLEPGENALIVLR